MLVVGAADARHRGDEANDRRRVRAAHAVDEDGKDEESARRRQSRREAADDERQEAEAREPNVLADGGARA